MAPSTGKTPFSPANLTKGNNLTPLQQAQGAQAVNYSSAAALAFLVYDVLITTGQEVDLMWNRRWSFMKLLYLFIRYIPLFVQASLFCIGTDLTPSFHFTPYDCWIWQVYQGIAALMIVMATDFILILRVQALYHDRFPIKLVAWGFYVAEIAAMVFSLAKALPGIITNDICIVLEVPNDLLIYGIASVAYQGLLFALTMYKFIQAVRGGWSRTPLVRTVVRDGTWGFVVIFSLILGDASLYLVPNAAYAGVLFGWLLTGFSMVGYRILLNLHYADTSSYRNNRTTRTTLSSGPELSTQLFFDPTSTSSGISSGFGSGGTTGITSNTIMSTAQDDYENTDGDGIELSPISNSIPAQSASAGVATTSTPRVARPVPV